MDFRFAVKTGYSPVPGKDVRSSLQKPFALLLMGRLSKGSQQSSRTMYRSQICSGQLLSETVEHRRLLMPDPVFGSSRLDGGGPAVRSARRPRGGGQTFPALQAWMISPRTGPFSSAARRCPRGAAAAAQRRGSGPQIAVLHYLNRRVFSGALRRSRERAGCAGLLRVGVLHSCRHSYYL